MLLLPRPHWERVIAHCLDGLPLEACGLLAGRAGPIPAGPGTPAPIGGAVGPDGGAGLPPDGGAGEEEEVTAVEEVFPTRNAARSARLYSVEPIDLLKADRAAENAGLGLVGVWHSHTHTPAYPSPTDIAQAPDPSWHYVLVSLSAPEPVLRSYRIVAGTVSEEPVLLT